MKPGNELLFLALGGSGEIGMNVNLYGCQGKWLMADLGMTFGDPNYPGIELVLPDLSFIEERRRDLLGIVLTHGHEDHIGAIPYLAADLGVPLYATPFTAALIAGKLEEEGLASAIELNVIDVGGSLQLGPFGIRFVPLAHSIAEANALLIDTPYGKVFHTGDWKLDDAPQIGRPTSDDAMKAIGTRASRARLRFHQRLQRRAFRFGGERARRARGGGGGRQGPGGGDDLRRPTPRGSTRSAACAAPRPPALRRRRSLDRILKVARATGYLTDFPDTIDFDTA
jgi:ribonuclease J